MFKILFFITLVILVVVAVVAYLAIRGLGQIVGGFFEAFTRR